MNGSSDLRLHLEQVDFAVQSIGELYLAPRGERSEFKPTGRREAPPDDRLRLNSG
ncbi:hypothetical protein LOCUS_55240 [Klebsiella pneumoniae]|nr:hypothetical protein LOCUS_55240 [Klebsiella pneumoniae]